MFELLKTEKTSVVFAGNTNSLYRVCYNHLEWKSNMCKK